MRIVCIVQARMGSTRLPGKVMMEIAGRPMLSHVVQKARMLNTDDIVVAVADEVPGCESPITEWCRKIGINYFVGPSNDVLLRYLRAAHKFEAEAIVRITADCPLLDPYTSNMVIAEFVHCSRPDLGYEYVSNIYPKRTFPKGWDTEIFTYGSLLLADQGSYKMDREHVTPWLQRNCKMRCLKAVKDYSKVNFSVDTMEDLDRVQRILG